MHPALLAISVCSGVLAADFIRDVTGKLNRTGRKYTPRDQSPFDSLLPTPLGYENLQRTSRAKCSSSSDLILGSRIGYGSYGVVFHGNLFFCFSTSMTSVRTIARSFASNCVQLPLSI